MASYSIPFFSPNAINSPINRELNAAFTSVLLSNQLILGKQVDLFESAYATYIGSKHCIGVGNGLDALVLALKACGVGYGHEVIVPAYTYTATWMAVTLVGATPVGVDVGADYNLNVQAVAGKITANTKAIIPVHLFGRPCNINPLIELANEYNLFIVEDNAQAAGSMYYGYKTGSLGHIAAHSFYPTKTLGALGDAGAVTTNNTELAQQVKMLRNYGSVIKNEHSTIGHNSRLDELQAAFLNVKLPLLDAHNEERRRLAALYNSLLAGIDGLSIPIDASEELYAVYHLYVIQTTRRNELKAFLESKGIETLVHYPTPPYSQQAFGYLNNGAANYPVADGLTAKALSLPLYPGLNAASVETVAKAIQAFFKT